MHTNPLHNTEPGRQKRRLFFAVELSPDIRSTLQDTAERVRKAAHFTPLQMNWVPAENYHVTLYFLGDVSQGVADKLHSFLQTEPPTVKTFALDVRHISTFPDEPGKQAKVLWAGVHRPSDALMQLRLYCGQLIARTGTPLPDQDFTPHVTLARFKTTKGYFAFRKMLDTYKNVKFGTCQVNRLVLMESITGGGPARYQPFVTASLKPE